MRLLYSSFFLFLIVAGSIDIHGQCNISLSYRSGDVDIDITSISIVAPDQCNNGYIYRVNIGYTVDITKKRHNFRLFTLQGNISCGGTDSFFDLPNEGGQGNVNSSPAWRSQPDCQTVTGALCNRITIQVNGVGVPNQWVLCEPLPIELIDFNVAKIKNTVRVYWQTASETNNDFFSVQRSHQGNEWEVLGLVKGAGNSSEKQSYEFFDDTPHYAKTNYYRVKQTDFDGTSSYSPIRSIIVPDREKIRIHPNPAKKYLTLEGPTPEIDSFRFYDRRGQDMTALTTITGSTLTTRILNISLLPAGSYIIKTKTTSHTIQKR